LGIKGSGLEHCFVGSTSVCGGGCPAQNEGSQVFRDSPNSVALAGK
jgi:hypothetical protein